MYLPIFCRENKSTKIGVLNRACSVEFIKHVLRKFSKPVKPQF